MITIQQATADDAATIAEIGMQSFIESHGQSASAADIDSYASRKYALDVVKRELENPQNIFHLIRSDGQVAGYSKIVLNVTNESILAQNITCLDRLYLLKDFYGQKLGLHLFEVNQNISKQSGQAGMWLYVWVENKRAITFYNQAGFRIAGKANFPISATHSNPNHIMYLEYQPDQNV